MTPANAKMHLPEPYPENFVRQVEAPGREARMRDIPAAVNPSVLNPGSANPTVPEAPSPQRDLEALDGPATPPQAKQSRLVDMRPPNPGYQGTQSLAASLASEGLTSDTS